ncbi:MAG: MFS transporter, partial [Actinomadura rubrobrunea]|nr:MFS transporter [Actinomadura rubrobrunea]
MFSTIPGLLLLCYLTNVLDVPAGAAGVAVLLPKAWDLLVNPLVGRLSDRTVSRHGPRRPWLLAGAVTLPPLFVLMFAGTPLRGMPAAFYVGGCFLLAATAYALFEVPYKAMPAEMTDSYHEQSELHASRRGVHRAVDRPRDRHDGVRSPPVRRAAGRRRIRLVRTRRTGAPAGRRRRRHSARRHGGARAAHGRVHRLDPALRPDRPAARRASRAPQRAAAARRLTLRTASP